MAEFSSANKDILKILQKPLKKQTNGEKKSRNEILRELSGTSIVAYLLLHIRYTYKLFIDRIIHFTRAVLLWRCRDFIVKILAQMLYALFFSGSTLK